jgi:hypothetical protein
MTVKTGYPRLPKPRKVDYSPSPANKRSRIIDKSLIGGYRHWSYVSFAGTGLVGHFNKYNLLRTRSGASMPQFKQKIRQHQDATTSLTGLYSTLDWSGDLGGVVHYTWDSTNGFVNSKTKQHERAYGNNTIVSMLSILPGPPSYTGNADGRASNKFLSEVRKTQTRFSGPTFLGELRETQRMLRRPAEALWKNLEGYERDLRKRKASNPKRWIYSIPDLWLEHAFGWRPLMMDIDDAFSALNSLLDGEHVEHISCGAVDSKVGNELNGTYTVAGTNYIRGNYRKVETWQAYVRYRGDVVVQAATTFADKAARWGFTPEEFLPTAWELLPWSFLVDYFTTIGDFIDASGARTSSIKWAARTQRLKTTVKAVGQMDVNLIRSVIPAANFLFAYPASQVPSYVVYTQTSISRSSVPTGSIQPDLSIRWEGPRWGQIANMAALLGSFNSGLHFQNPSKRTYRL